MAVFMHIESCHTNSMSLLHVVVQHTDMGSISANATAARIVKTVQSLYHVNINQSAVIEQFIYTFSSQLDMLAGQPLSPEAQLYWYWQLQNMQLQNRSATVTLCHPPYCGYDL